MKKKTAIVTGAGRGIGKAIAKRLSKDGMNVAILDINLKTAEVTASEISNYGGEVLTVKCDVSNEDSVKAAVESVVDVFGAVDVLVNNAGILSSKKPFAEYAKEEWDRVLGVNLMGTVFMCKAVIPHMKKQNYGRIINMASQAAVTGGRTAASPVYATSKAAIICVTKALVSELGPYQITANTIAPGFIVTEMTKNAGYEKLTGIVPLRRTGTPEDVADAAAFLAGEDGRYVSGVVLYVNGGNITSMS